MVFVGGIDEAGRGPVLGPMVMAIVACEPKDKAILQNMGVKDSKLLTPKKRNELFLLIKNQFPHAIISVSPKEIDKHVTSEGTSLNRLEAITSGKLIRRLNSKVKLKSVMLDLPSKNKEQYLSQVTGELTKNDKDTQQSKSILGTQKDESILGIKIEAEFKADLNYLEVSAASILAKVTRDKSIVTIEKKLGFKIGSGYPADPNTVKSLNENLTVLMEEYITRKSWKTVTTLLEKKKQSNLFDF